MKKINEKYFFGHPKFMGKDRLILAINILEDTRSQCDDPVIYLQKIGLWPYYSITSLRDAEADILNPESPYQEHGEIFSLEYLLKIKRGLDQGLEYLEAGNSAELLIRDMKYYLSRARRDLIQLLFDKSRK